uniref:YHYH domain-containing protein n=1 Tax=viral metagenome TaxID=1070528 RepID=A0A6C0D139_9ZZZZ
MKTTKTLLEPKFNFTIIITLSILTLLSISIVTYFYFKTRNSTTSTPTIPTIPTTPTSMNAISSSTTTTRHSVTPPTRSNPISSSTTSTTTTTTSTITTNTSNPISTPTTTSNSTISPTTTTTNFTTNTTTSYPISTFTVTSTCLNCSTTTPIPTLTPLCSSMTVFYSTITNTDDIIYLWNDVWSDFTTRYSTTYDIYNVYIAYSTLTYTGTVTKFTSYYEYTDTTGVIKSNEEYIITFFSGSTNVVMSSTKGTISSYTLPFQGMSNTFCLPLIRIPTTATNIAFGIQLTTLDESTGYETVYTQTVQKSPTATSSSPNSTDSNYMRTFASTIYDSETIEYAKPLSPLVVNSISTTLPSGVSLFSQSPTPTSTPIAEGMTVDAYRTLLLTTLNSAYSYYNDNLYTTSFTDLVDNPSTGNAKLYFFKNSPPTPSDAVGLGCWFIPSSDSSIATPPSCYTTSYPNISMTSKMNNFATFGLNTDLISSGSYSVTPSMTTIGNNSYPTINVSSSSSPAILYPVHPYGTFPSSSVSQVSTFVATNPTAIKLKTMYGSYIAATSSSTDQTLGAGVIGYLFDNAALYAAGDAEGYTPITRECLDIFFGHPDSSGMYHHHYIGPTMTNWCMSTTLRVIGFLSDGYPLVAPFLIKDTSESRGYRFVKTSDLNKYHGLEGSFTVSIPDSITSTTTTTLTYGFMYVTTYDFPFTTSAFYGKPATTTRS